MKPGLQGIEEQAGSRSAVDLGLFDLLEDPDSKGVPSPPGPGASRVRNDTSTVLTFSTARVGALSQMHVEQELIERGCQVFRPVLEGGEIDLIALTPTGRFWRIQVKSGSYSEVRKTGNGRKRCVKALLAKRGRQQDGTRKFNKPYTQIDAFVVVYQKACWVVLASQVGSAKTHKSLGFQSPAREAWHLMGLGEELS